MSSLRWVRRPDLTLLAYSGEFLVGIVSRSPESGYSYRVSALDVQWLKVKFGTRGRERSAKEAVENAWADLLSKAGLERKAA